MRTCVFAVVSIGRCKTSALGDSHPNWLPIAAPQGIRRRVSCYSLALSCDEYRVRGKTAEGKKGLATGGRGDKLKKWAAGGITRGLALSDQYQ